MSPLFLPRTQANPKSILNKYTLNSYRNFMVCLNLDLSEVTTPRQSSVFFLDWFTESCGKKDS